MVSIVAISNISCYCHLLWYWDMINQCSTICFRFFTICLNLINVNMEQQCLLHVIDISSLKSPTMHVGVSFSFETKCNSSSVNLDIGVDGGLYTDMICSFVGSVFFTASISQSQFSTISSGMNFLFIMSATPPPALLQSYIEILIILCYTHHFWGKSIFLYKVCFIQWNYMSKFNYSINFNIFQSAF